jgi:hypothetical protein
MKTLKPLQNGPENNCPQKQNRSLQFGGGYTTCASSFTPKSLLSGLSDTGEHGIEKIFAPGQEAQVSDSSASSFAPGDEKL